MIYPPAPWTLKGYALQTLHAINIQRARIFVPSQLEIISVVPGHTLGGVYLSTYKSGSTLEYNELVVVAALVRYANHVGAWISHIYVDNEDSVAGGREIWGLPKELAQFTWDNNSISVRQGDRELCQLRYQKDWFSFSSWWQQPFSWDVFGGLESQLLLFNGKLKGQFGLIQGSLTIPKDSPITKLNLEQPWLSVECNNLDAVVGKPRVVGDKIDQVYR